MNKFKLGIAIIIFSLVSAATVFAGGPGKGEITVYPGGKISQLTVRYNISQLMGEPVINGTYKWTSSSLDKLDSNVVVWLTISNSQNGSAYIKIDPTVPDNGEWGFNVSGSPNWNQALVSSYSGNQAQGYVDADIAKEFWQNGFKVVDARLSRNYR